MSVAKATPQPKKPKAQTNAAQRHKQTQKGKYTGTDTSPADTSPAAAQSSASGDIGCWLKSSGLRFLHLSHVRVRHSTSESRVTTPGRACLDLILNLARQPCCAYMQPCAVNWESDSTYTCASHMPPPRRHLTRQNTASGRGSSHLRASTAQHIVSTSRGACQEALRWKLLAGVPLRARKRVSWRHKLLILQFGVTYRERVRGIRLNHPPLGMVCTYTTGAASAGWQGPANVRGSQHLAQPQSTGSSRNTKTAPDKSGAFKLFPAIVSSIRNDQAPPFGSNNLAVTTTRRIWRYRMQRVVGTSRYGGACSRGRGGRKAG